MVEPLAEDVTFAFGQHRQDTPEPNADLALGIFVASRGGEFGAVNQTLEHPLGHKPTDWRDVLAARWAG